MRLVRRQDLASSSMTYGPVVELDEALVQVRDPAAFQPVNGAGDAVQEGAVVADHQQGEAAWISLFSSSSMHSMSRWLVGSSSSRLALRRSCLGEAARRILAAGQALRGFVRLRPKVSSQLSAVHRSASPRGGVVGQVSPGDDRLPAGHRRRVPPDERSPESA